MVVYPEEDCTDCHWAIKPVIKKKKEQNKQKTSGGQGVDLILFPGDTRPLESLPTPKFYFLHELKTEPSKMF